MILVIGASGTNGRALVDELSRRGVHTRAGHRDPEKAPPLPHVERVRLDIDEPATVQRALEGVERVFIVSPSSPRLAEREGAAADEAKRAGARQVVLVSTSRADKEDYIFGRWHRASERRIEASGVPFTVLRPSSYMQSTLLLFAPAIRKKGAIVFPAQRASVCHVDVRDVAAAAATVLTAPIAEHSGKAYHLTGAEAFGYARMAEVFSEVLGRPIQYIDPDEAAYRKSMIANGAPEGVADAMTELCRYYVAGKGEGVAEDLPRILGRPPTSFRRFVEDHVAAFR